MSRKFNTTGGLLSGAVSLEDETIVEGNEVGLNATDDQLFDHPADQQLPEEAKDILSYFTEEKAQELSEAGPELTMESFWNLITDIESVRTSVRNEGGVSQSLAMECERLMPGFFTDDYPVKTFSVIPTRTNLNYTVEAFDVRSGAIIGAIIAIILGIAKLMFGGGGSSSSSGSDGGGGVADKVDAGQTAAIKKSEEVVAKIDEALKSGKLDAAMVHAAVVNHLKIDDPALLKTDDPLITRIDDVNEHVKKGLNGLQHFIMGFDTEKSTVFAKTFWESMGKGNYTDAVINMAESFERLSAALKSNTPSDGMWTSKQIGGLGEELSACYASLTNLGVFKHIPPIAGASAAQLLDSPDAYKLFTENSPTAKWLADITMLEMMTVSGSYAKLLNLAVTPTFVTANDFISSDFKVVANDVNRRASSHAAIGANATGAIASIKSIFAKTNVDQSNIDDLTKRAEAEGQKTAKACLQLCEFFLKSIRDFSHIFNKMRVSNEHAIVMVERDLETIEKVNALNAKAKEPKAP